MKNINKLLVVASLALCASGVNAQVPSSIAGLAIESTITDGVYPFRSSGSSLMLTTSDGRYSRVMVLAWSISTSFGSYSYSKTDEWNATVSGPDISAWPTTTAIHALTPSTGTFKSTMSDPSVSPAFQVGTYRIYNGKAPDSLQGRTFQGVIQGGQTPFATSGIFQFVTSSTGNTYKIIGGDGVTSSTGTYTYAKVSQSGGTLSMTDSAIGQTFTENVNWDTSTKAAYLATGSEGYQAGTLTEATDCTGILSETNATVYWGGGVKTFTLTIPDSCSWTVATNVSWLRASPTSGHGSATIRYLVGVNMGRWKRTGTITVNSNVFTVEQSSSSWCYCILSPTAANASASGDAGRIAVNAGDGCNWTATSSAAWLHTTSATNGSGIADYTVDANTNETPRTGTITVGDKTFLVTQSGMPPVITQQPASQSAIAGATIYLTAVATGPGQLWVWQKNGVTVPDGGHYTGVYTPTLTIHGLAAADAGNYSAWVGNAAAWVKTSNATVTVCSYSLASTSTNFASGGGAGDVGVIAPAGCGWTASADVSWLHTTSSGAGSGTAAFTVDANASVIARTGTITVQGQTFTVNQAGVVCGFILSTTSARLGTNGGIVEVVINNPCGGSWTATNNGVEWITVVSGSSGVVTPGTVQLEVAQNDSGKARSAYVTIGGQSFGVFQGPFKTKGDLDFDGDGKADITVYDPVPGDWYVLLSKGGSTSFRWGGGSMVPVHGDFDGDGKSDRAVYYPETGQWFLTLSGGGMKAMRWGSSSAVPMPGDFDGDGKTDCCVWETNNGDWYIAYSSGGSTTIHWGWKGTVPVVGDLDGDGKTDIANYDPKPGNWYVRYANSNMAKFNWGGGGMVPMVGDFNGDGRVDAVVYYAAEGMFYIRNSSGGMGSIKWAGGNMQPVLADFDGDGKTDIAGYDASGGTWYIRYATGAMKMVKWGWSQAVAP